MSPPAFDDARSHWNTRFARPGYLFGTAPNAWLTQQASRLKPGMRALCVADGEGRNSVWLARQGLQVEAFDIAELAVEKARALASQRGVEIGAQCCSVDEWQWLPDSADLVVAIFVQFADPEMRARMFAGMKRSLAPGGLLLLQGYALDQLALGTGGPGRPEHLYTPELLRSLCTGLEIIELSQYQAELAEGSQHVGMSALIGLVARKPVQG